jgi:CRISPR-associated protein Cmr2
VVRFAPAIRGQPGRGQYTVENNGGKLIFPATTKAENVANVILAELPDGDPKEVARKAREAAQERWLQFADDAWSEASEVIRQDIWNEQVDDVIEFYAAWVTRSDNYKKDREKVMGLLAGRKSFRDFQPANGRAGVPKSSLDGQRESVLKDPAREPLAGEIPGPTASPRRRATRCR